jgi:glycosyltransferase involved in cell wall biosynthesis
MAFSGGAFVISLECCGDGHSSANLCPEGEAVRSKLTRALIAGVRYPGAARWLYFNSKAAAALALRKLFGKVLRWLERQASQQSLVKDADRRMAEILLPGFKSISQLGKYDYAIEAMINDRFRDLRLLRVAEYKRPMFRRFERHDALFTHPYRAIVCVPWQRSGGAEKVAANLAHAMSDLYGPQSVAILVLDFTPAYVKNRYPHEPSVISWFPKGVSIIDLSDTTDMDSGERIEILANIFLAVAPEIIINVNSKSAWECFLNYGRQLSRHIRLAACLFCNHYSPYGAPAGYAVTYFRETLPVMDTILSDQQYFLDDLAQRYGLTTAEKEKLFCLYQPVGQAVRPSHELARYQRLSQAPAYRRQVLWASRVTAQKNPDFLIKIVRASPSYDFHVYGAQERTSRLPGLCNLFVHGAFSTFDDIPHEKFDVFLYTSLWDGLPNILLEAAERRLPIIAPIVGGIGELVTTQTGWPIKDPNDATAFCDSLRQVLFEFDVCAGQRRVDAMFNLIRSRHTVAAFTESISTLIDGEQLTCPQQSLAS